MSGPININRSARAFSLAELQEWLTAVRDAQYNEDWLDALKIPTLILYRFPKSGLMP
jgi:hypothetical protein